MFIEGRIKFGGRSILLRLEGFNLFNHGTSSAARRPPTAIWRR